MGVERWLQLMLTVLHLCGVAAVRDEWWGVEEGEIHTKLPVRWSCLKLPRLDKHHQKRISPRFSPPRPSLPPLRCLPFPSSSPHHGIIVSGRATRLVDTQSGKRGAMMNCSLLVLSTMIIINFPPALTGEWGPENCGVTAPPPWAVTEPPIITYHRQSLGPRLKRWWKWKALILKCPVF